MDWTKLDTLDGTRSSIGSPMINDVQDTTQSALPDGNPNKSASVYNLLATDETLGTVHSNGSDRVLAMVDRDLEDRRPPWKSWASRALRIGGRFSVSN